MNVLYHIFSNQRLLQCCILLANFYYAVENCHSQANFEYLTSYDYDKIIISEQGHTGYIQVERNGLTGFVNIKGEEVIPCQFEKVYSFKEGLAFVKNEGNDFFIDTLGKVVIQAPGEIYKFYNVHVTNGMILVIKDGKFGAVDKKGNLRVDVEFESLSTFKYFPKSNATNSQSFYARARREHRVGYVGTNGRFLSKRDASNLTSPGTEILDLSPPEKFIPFHEPKTDKWGFANELGKLVVPCRFDQTRGINNHLGWVKRKDKWAMIKYTAENINPPPLNMPEEVTDFKSIYYAREQLESQLSTSIENKNELLKLARLSESISDYKSAIDYYVRLEPYYEATPDSLSKIRAHKITCQYLHQKLGSAKAETVMVEHVVSDSAEKEDSVSLQKICDHFELGIEKDIFIKSWIDSLKNNDKILRNLEYLNRLNKGLALLNQWQGEKIDGNDFKRIDQQLGLITSLISIIQSESISLEVVQGLSVSFSDPLFKQLQSEPNALLEQDVFENGPKEPEPVSVEITEGITYTSSTGMPDVSGEYVVKSSIGNSRNKQKSNGKMTTHEVDLKPGDRTLMPRYENGTHGYIENTHEIFNLDSTSVKYVVHRKQTYFGKVAEDVTYEYLFNWDGAQFRCNSIPIVTYVRGSETALTFHEYEASIEISPADELVVSSNMHASTRYVEVWGESTNKLNPRR